MMDIKSKEKRSQNMSRIKSSNTSIELKIRKLLYNSGFRYRVNYSAVTGKPDIYISKLKTAVFVNGCFWHRHKDCRYSYMPKSNIEFWSSKFEKNMERDKNVVNELNSQGIRVIVIWECTVKGLKNEEDNKEFLDNFRNSLESEELYIEL